MSSGTVLPSCQSPQGLNQATKAGYACGSSVGNAALVDTCDMLELRAARMPLFPKNEVIEK